MELVEVKDIKDIVNDKSEARFMSFMQKKAQKILKASYIITENIKDTEPLRSDVRLLAQNFLKDTNLLAAGISGSSGETARSMFATLKSLEGLMEGGIIASFWAPDIGNIVRSELFQIASLLERRVLKPAAAQEYINKEFFSVELPIEPQREVKTRRPDFASGAFAQPSKPTQASSLTGRSDVILGVLDRLGTATIKEIISEARFSEETGEKTVQRELLSLLSLGKIERHGERRWSRYALPGRFQESPSVH